MDLLTPLNPPRATESAPLWMLTFADLLSLLLAFFVLLFATTSADQQRWQARIAPIAKFLAGTSAEPVDAATPPPPASAAKDLGYKDLGYIAAVLDGLVESVPALAGGEILRDRHGVTLRLSRDPLSEASRVALARILAALPNAIELRAVWRAGREAETGEGAVWQSALADAAKLRADLARRSGRHDLAATGGLAPPRHLGGWGTPGLDHLDVRVLDGDAAR